MSTTPTSLWSRYKQYLCTCPSIGLSLDISRMNFDDAFLNQLKAPMQKAFAAMDELEAGAIANPDEQRMVGHYWLRDPGTVRPQPPAQIRKRNQATTLAAIKKFAADIHSGKINSRRPARCFPSRKRRGGRRHGPRAIHQTSSSSASAAPRSAPNSSPTPSPPRATDKMKVAFFDNTDPDGMDRTLRQIALTGESLGLEKKPSQSSSPNPAAPRKPATACSPPPLPTKKPASPSPNMPSPSPEMAPNSTKSPSRKNGSPASPCGTGSAAAPPNSLPSDSSPPPCRASTSTPCSPAPR